MSQSMVRHLTVCVDDFGQHDGVNQAVLDLLRLKRISAVSCLVDGASWPRAAADLKALAYSQGADALHQADVGLHLNLTECLDPVAQAAWSSRPLGALIRAAYLRQLDPVLLQTEVARQWDRFVSVWGAEPDFVDGHQHVHQLPQVRDALMTVLDQRLSPSGKRPWLRCCLSPGWRAVTQGVGLGDAVKAHVIGALGASALAGMARQRGLQVSRHLLGVYPFDADAPAYTKRWQAWLNLAQPQGDVLMCHPAKPGVDMGGVVDVIAESRQMEYQVLTGPQWAGMLAQSGTQVTVLTAG